jgi:general stress protein CsbA
LLSPLTYATWLLCGLGAVVLTASARRSWQTLVILGVVSIVSGIWMVTDPRWIGFLTAAAAVSMIVRPSWDWVAACAAGLLIGALGYSVWFVVPTAVGVAAACAIPLPRRIIREEALAGLVVFGLLLVLVPSVTAGWRSALALNVANQTNSGQAVPNWVLLLVVGSVIVGGLYQGLYRRR